MDGMGGVTQNGGGGQARVNKTSNLLHVSSLLLLLRLLWWWLLVIPIAAIPTVEHIRVLRGWSVAEVFVSLPVPVIPASTIPLVRIRLRLLKGEETI